MIVQTGANQLDVNGSSRRNKGMMVILKSTGLDLWPRD
jgi:hypothetical protein